MSQHEIIEDLFQEGLEWDSLVPGAGDLHIDAINEFERLVDSDPVAADALATDWGYDLVFENMFVMDEVLATV